MASRNRDANALRLAEAGQGLEAALRLLRRFRGGRKGELAAAPGGRSARTAAGARGRVGLRVPQSEGMRFHLPC